MEGTMQDDFRFFKLPLASRLLAAGAFYVAGLAVALALRSAHWLGLVLVAAGWVPLMLRVATNRPEDRGLEEWRPVPMEEIDRLDDGLREAQKLRRKVSRLPADTEAVEKLGEALGSIQAKRRLPNIVVVAIFLLVGFSMIAERTDWLLSFDGGAIFFGLAALFVLLVPALFFGRVKVYSPPEIAMKMPCFRAMLGEELPPEVAVAPYVRFDKDKNGADLPEDLRFLYELKRPPSDLVGVQVQAAVNRGPEGKVPYMYAVVLTKGVDGPSYAAARDFRHPGYEVEAGGDEKYGSVVVRQKTGNGGYATTPHDCQELAGICLKLLAEISAGA